MGIIVEYVMTVSTIDELWGAHKTRKIVLLNTCGQIAEVENLVHS